MDNTFASCDSCLELASALPSPLWGSWRGLLLSPPFGGAGGGSLHARAHSQRGGNSGDDAHDDLKNQFPSFFVHSEKLIVNS